MRRTQSGQAAELMVNPLAGQPQLDDRPERPSVACAGTAHALQRLRDFGHSWRALSGLIAVKRGQNRETVTVSISRPPPGISLPGAPAARAHYRAFPVRFPAE